MSFQMQLPQLPQQARRTAMRVLTAAFVLSPMIATLQAQAIVRGILYDDAKGTPLRGTVMLVDPATDAAVAHVAADSLGQFDMQIPRGVYQLAAVREGYNSVLSAPIPLANGERLTIRIPISNEGDPQHHIGVLEHVKPDAQQEKQVESMRKAEMGGFENRRITGTGLHYDRAAFEQSHFRTLGEFLQNVPGMRVTDPNSTSSMAFSRNSASMMTGSSLVGGVTSSCHVGWFIDGHRIDLPGRYDPVTDGLGTMSLDAIEGVEVFRGLSEMPSEFAEPDLRCGAVAIWSRKS